MITSKHTLSTMKRDGLIDLAKLYGITGCSKLRKKVILDRIIDYLLFPTVMYHRLSVLDDKEIALFRELLEKNIIINRENIYTAASLLKTMYVLSAEYGEADIMAGLIVGVKESYNRFDHVKFEKNRKKVCRLVKCLEFSNKFYGITPVDVLLEVFNQKPKMRVAKEDLLRLFHQIPLDLKRNILSGDEFYDYTYSGVEIKYVHNEQQDKEYFIPSHQQIEFYQKHGFFDEPGYRELRAHLSKITDKSFPEISEILAEIFHFLYMESDVQEILDYLGETVVFKNEPEVIKLLDFVDAAHNDTRLLENRGHTPNEMANLLKRRVKPPQTAPNGVDKSKESSDVSYYEDDRKILKPFVHQKVKVYPNDPCSCNSGKKYKKCCGKK